MREQSHWAGKAEEVNHLSNIMKSTSFEKGNFPFFSLKEVSPTSPDLQTKKGKNDPSETGAIQEEDQLTEDAVNRLKKIEREAYERGFSSGEGAGRELGLKRLEPTEKILLTLIKEVEGLKASVLDETKNDIIMVALAMARRIVGSEISQNHEILLKNIQKAIKKIGQTEKLTLRLHPNDIEPVSQDSNDLLNTLKEGHLLRLSPDTRLSPGECIIEGEDQMIDLRSKSQFNIFEENLRKSG